MADVKTYSISLAAQTIGVSPKQLYYWEQIGIVAPAYEDFGAHSYRRYSQEDVEALAKVKRLLDAGYTLRAAARKVRGNGIHRHRHVPAGAED